jgi:hypothetical protein
MLIVKPPPGNFLEKTVPGHPDRLEEEPDSRDYDAPDTSIVPATIHLIIHSAHKIIKIHQLLY